MDMTPAFKIGWTLRKSVHFAQIRGVRWPHSDGLVGKVAHVCIGGLAAADAQGNSSQRHPGAAAATHKVLEGIVRRNSLEHIRLITAIPRTNCSAAAARVDWCHDA